MTKVAINTFITGLDKDSDKVLIKPSSYLHAENFRLFSDDKGTSGALTNVKGNINFTEWIIPTNQTIVGHCSIRNDLYLFTKGNVTILGSGVIIGFYPGSAGVTKVYSAVPVTFIDGDKVIITSNTGYYNGTYTVFDVGVDGVDYWFRISKQYGGASIGSWEHSIFDDRLYRITIDDTTDPPETTEVKLIFSRTDFAFSINHPVICVGRYENENIQKIYWSDGVSSIRFLNVADYLPDGTENDLTYINNLSIDSFEMTPNAVMPNIKLQNIVGGTLKSGTIQYSYQLYNRNGSETVFSPGSNLISLTKDNDFQQNNKIYGGSPLFINDDEENGRVNTGKGLELKVSDIDDNFNRIRVVSIYYSELYAVPEINIVYEGAFSNGEVSFIDSGYSLGRLTAEEVSLIGQLSLSVKSIEVKDNRLFIGNITEDYFDISDESFDARSYRFKSNADGFVYDFDGTNEIEIDDGEAYWNIPLNHDAFNPFNNLNNDGDSNYEFKYQSDGITPGGEGPNISYQFTTSLVTFNKFSHSNTFQATFAAEQENSSYSLGGDSFIAKSYSDYSSPFRSGLLRGYQRDEIYRFGIVFFDKKMRAAPAKWIGDVRFPSLLEKPIKTIAFQDSLINILGITFIVNVPEDVKNKISGYQIVRLPRKAEDRTIVCQGYGESPHKVSDTSDIYAPPTGLMLSSEYNSGLKSPGSRAIKKDIITLISPEINFNKNINLLPNDFLSLQGFYAAGTSFSSTTAHHQFQRALLFNSLSWINPQSRAIDELHLSGVIQNNSNDDISIKGIQYRNYAFRSIGSNYRGHAGTRLVLGIESAFNVPNIIEFLIFNYKRKATQYGGASYLARSTNKYISVSPFVKGDFVGNIFVFGGDTFISNFNYLKTSYDPTVPSGQREIYTVSFPVETNINLTLRHDINYNKLALTDNNRVFLQERKELGLDYADTYTDYIYPTNYTSLYLYNSVYSRENDSKEYFARPLDIQVVKEYDCRVYNSDKKINGELSDSWTKFLPNNYIEVDSKYGPINKLINYKDKLLSFQDKAISILSVNYQSVIQDGNSTSLVLGSGGVLDRYDYISTYSGSKHNTSIVGSPMGLFWFDANNKKIYRLGQLEEPISDIKGMNSYFQENIKGDILTSNLWSNIADTHVIGAYDDKFMEMLYTFKMNDIYEANSFTLSYNSKIDNFVSFYTFIPQLFIEHNKKLYSAIQTSSYISNLWLHNYGTYGSFYNIINPSTLKVLVNDDYLNTKTFDICAFVSESLSNNINIYNDTFSVGRIYNDYQNTDWFSLIYQDNIERRERTWSFHIPRDIVNTSIESSPDIFNLSNLDPTRLFKARMRDKYIVLDFIYNNSNNYKFTIPAIATKYRISYR